MEKDDKGKIGNEIDKIRYKKARWERQELSKL